MRNETRSEPGKEVRSLSSKSRSCRWSVPPPPEDHLSIVSSTARTWSINRVAWTWLALVLLTALTLADDRNARAKDQSPSRVVIELTSEGDDAEPILAILHQAFGESFQAEVVELDALLDTGIGPWMVAPPAQLHPCSIEPLPLATIESSLADIEGLVQSLEFESALRQIDTLEDALCASDGPLPTLVLARIPYLRGIGLFYLDDKEGARSAFKLASERDPDHEWDTTFPPDPQQVFLLGVADAIHAPRSRLVLPTEERPGQLYIDGRAVDLAIRVVELVGERHLLQFGVEGDEVRGAWLQISGIDEVELVGPQTAREGLVDGPGTETGDQAYSLLAGAAEAAGYSEVLVVQDSDGDHARWFNSIDGTWKEISLAAGHKLRQSRNQKAAGGVLLGAGGALMVAGGVIAAHNYAAATQVEQEMVGSAGMYSLRIDEFKEHKVQSEIGLGLLAGGGVMSAIGIPLLIRGTTLQKKTPGDPRLTFIASPGEITWIGLSGEF